MNYIKYSFRKIWNNKFFSLINFLGLTSGVCAFFILFIYTQNEKSFDQHFQNSEKIYRVSSMATGIDDTRWARSLGMVHQATSNIPEVEKATWFSHTPTGTISIENRQLQQKDIFSVDKEFVELFEVEALVGDLSELTEPNTAFISERMAEKYFNNENPVGKTIKIEALQYVNDVGTYEIRGIVKNTHPKTHFNYEILLSQNGALGERFESLPDSKAQWVYNYYLLKKDAKPKQVEKALQNHFQNSSLTKTRGPKKYRFTLTPLSSIHLHTNDRFELKNNSNKINIGLFVAIAFTILLVSIFNFTILNLARLLKRMPEFKIKKSMGATTKQLVVQILTEFFFVFLFAAALALGVVELIKPLVNRLFEIRFEIYYNEPMVYFTIISLIAISTGITGIFVLFLLRKNQKFNNIRKTPAVTMRPILIAQLATLIILLAAAFAVNKQIGFMLNNPMGFEKENVVVLHVKDFTKDPAVFASELEKQSQVASVGFTMQHFGYPPQNLSFKNEFGVDGEVAFIFANYDYLKTMKIEFIENWIPPQTDTVRGMVINEHYYNRLMEKHGNMENLKIFQAGQPLEEDQSRINIIGVTKNFNHTTAHEPIGDFAIWLNETANRARFIHVRLNACNLHPAMKNIEKLWNRYYPGQDFDYFFLDDYVANQYKAEIILSRVLFTFSLLGILICIIGTSAVSLFISQQRTKEIGIRKVNGARISEVLTMLNKDFVKWATIAFVIATPVAYYAMHKWLQNFAYKTNLSWWIFALAGLLALVVALLAVTFQSWKAARRNPVEALRYE
ncbi:MAG: ABC transporter permease [Prolixibacteraceae bacterium]|nr:ABC transporter permease [Prolixibacteraceae bacterium]